MSEELLAQNEALRGSQSTPARPPTTTAPAASSATSPKIQQPAARISKNPRKSLTTARRKACGACSVAKVRCDLSKPSCSRCSARSLQCRYAHATRDYRGGAYLHTPTSQEGFAQPTEAPRYQNPPAPVFGLGGAVASSGTAASPLLASAPGSQTYPSAGDHNSYLPVGDNINLLHRTDLTTANTGGETLHSPAGQVGARSSGPFLQPPLQQSDTHELPAAPQSNNNSSPVDLASPNLVCNVDASRVRDRWFREFEPPANQQPKEYMPGVLHFVSRVLASFPGRMANGEITSLPPIVHPAQMRSDPVPTPLVNCITLTRMWEGRVSGAEAIVKTTIIGEMERLLQERHSYDQLNLLAAFQAYLIYTILLFFPGYKSVQHSSDDATQHSPLDDASQLATRMTMINLQELAHDLVLTGLICHAELPAKGHPATHGDPIPDLSSWILANTKRRTLVAMYILDSTYCNVNNLLWFNADEIGNLPAPGNKALWNASIRCSRGDQKIEDADAEWRREYKRYLAVWEGPDGRAAPLRTEEFWPDRVKTGEKGRSERERRVGQWVGEVDEFGMMLFGVVGVTHLC